MNIKRQKYKTPSLSGKLIFCVISLLCVFIVGILSIIVFSYSSSVETTYTNQVISTSEQALSNYTTYINNLVMLSDVVQVKLDNEVEEDIKKNTTSYFDEIIAVSNSMKSIALYDENGTLLSSNTFYKNSNTKEQIVKEDWFVSATSNRLINCFSRVDSASCFTLSKVVSINNGNSYAILNITYDFTEIASMIDEAKLGDGGHVFIYNNEYKVVYSSNKITENEFSAIKENILGTIIYKEDNNSYFIYISTIPNTRWRVAITTNINELYIAKKELFIRIFFYTISALIIFSITIFLLSNQITKPLVKLQKRMEQINDLNLLITDEKPIGGTKEIQSLNNSYIALMNRIHDLTKKVVDEQKEQNKAELQALQNQINPHFLYNTLDSIVYLIDDNENEKAEEMIIALSRFFRISISRGKNIIPVKDEISHVKYYLSIQKIRFGDKFEYQVESSPEIESLYVLKLILQPIVENAIIHGIGESQKACEIKIKGYIKDEFLCFDISDNGYGMLPNKIEEIYASFKDKHIHKGVGISNVYHRLKLYYGEKANIQIESKLDYGTNIHIMIPKEALIDHEENENK